MKRIYMIHMIAVVLLLTACGAKPAPEDSATTIQTDPQTSAESQTAASEASQTAAVDDTAYQEYLNSLQYLEEVEEKFRSANTTLDMLTGMVESRDAWDTELNKIYELLSEKLSTEQMEELRTIQRQWIKDRDQKAEQYAAHFEGGTFYPVARSDILFQCTKLRTFELIDIYFDKSTDYAYHLDTISDDPKGNDSDPSVEQVSIESYHIEEKYYDDNNQNYVELILELPRLSGNYDGIPAINTYFANKEQGFYEDLPLDILEELEGTAKIEGRSSGYFVSARYYLETQFGDIISISGDLDGGAGGVSWAALDSNVFNLSTGEKLEISDLFNISEEECMDFIYDYVSNEIKNEILAGNGLYFFDDVNSEEGMRRIRSYNPNNFYLSGSVLVVFYNRYELAAGAAGTQVFEIPYDMIKDMLAIDVNLSN